jgi:uncharacterized protein YbaP (TraB family)
MIPLRLAGMAAPLALLLLLSYAGMVRTEPVEEIVITGKGSGPPLWEVRKGANSLFIFGQHSPLPKKLDWDSSRVESLLQDADAYLTGLSLHTSEGLPGPIRMFRLLRRLRGMRHLEDGKTLDAVLPPDLYQKILRIKETYGPRGKDFFRLRPYLAATELREAMLDKVGLDGNPAVAKRIADLVRKYDVPKMSANLVTEARYEVLLDSIDEVSFENEVACLATLVETLETDVETLRDQALAWSYGQVDALRDLHQEAGRPCLDALTASELAKRLLSDARDLWLNQATIALHSKRLTFTQLPIGELLRVDGLLAELERAGFEVVRP